MEEINHSLQDGRNRASYAGSGTGTISKTSSLRKKPKNYESAMKETAIIRPSYQNKKPSTISCNNGHYERQIEGASASAVMRSIQPSDDFLQATFDDDFHPVNLHVREEDGDGSSVGSIFSRYGAGSRRYNH